MNNFKKLQKEIICNCLRNLENKYLSEKKICQSILQGNEKQKITFEIIEVLHQNIITSLNFEQYSRASKYLILMANLCRKGA